LFEAGREFLDPVHGVYLRRIHMIDLDFGPGAMAFDIAIAIIGPILYSFFVDFYDKPAKR
jgi:hypothetical protein